MDPLNKGAPSKSKSEKAGKTKALPRTEALLKRQSLSSHQTRTHVWLTRIVLKLEDKLWLETHVWHAKRMKMEILWGYRLVRFTLSHASQKFTLSY